jgi:hypothetical protein
MADGAYAAMPLQAQADLMAKEVLVIDALNSKATMWTKAHTEITQASSSVGSATDALEPHWPDQAGDGFIVRTRNGKKTLDTWARNIESTNVSKALTDLGQLVFNTNEGVLDNLRKAQEALAKAVVAPGQDAAAVKAAIEKPYQDANGQLMDTLDKDYLAKAAVLRAAASGPEFEKADANPTARPGGAAPGGESPGGGDQGQQDSAQQGGEQAGGGEEAGGAQAGGDQAGGADAGAGGAGGAGGEPPVTGLDDPSLSGGLGAAPTVPPVNFPPNIPPPVTSVPGGGGLGLPLVPSAGFGIGVRGGGGGVGGGGRIPGVNFGAGPTGAGSNTIAAAATPVQPPTTPVQAAAPVTPGLATQIGGAPGGPGGGMPMMPPMGGAGMGAAAGGGSGGGPGPGGVQRPGNGRRRDRDGGPTPGMPVALSGKAGRFDPHAFSVRSRAVESEHDPSTVQLIDEDLWQVSDTAPAPVVGEQQAPVRRVRR